MKITRLSFTLLLLLAAFTLGAQDWDTNYPETNFKRLIQFEKEYADSIQNNPDAVQYYSRLDKYRFTAEYMGESRKIEPEVMTSMKNVFRLFVGSTDQLESLVKAEYKFRVGEFELWMPIQQQLEKHVKLELQKGDKAKLYCLFMNEHGMDGRLYNTFLISEFIKTE